MSKNSDHQIQQDQQLMQRWLDEKPDTTTVAGFVPGPGIQKLHLTFDIDRLQDALKTCLKRTDYKGDTAGFGAFSLTRRPGVEIETPNDLSGLFYTRVDDSYREVKREELVDESAFTEFVPTFRDTYFEHVHSELTKRFQSTHAVIVQRTVQLQLMAPRSGTQVAHTGNFQSGIAVCGQSHVTHLPADGSVYFTDTRGYHTALNGGETHRVHIVAALPI